MVCGMQYEIQHVVRNDPGCSIPLDGNNRVWLPQEWLSLGLACPVKDFTGSRAGVEPDLARRSASESEQHAQERTWIAG